MAPKKKIVESPAADPNVPVIVLHYTVTNKRGIATDISRVVAAPIGWERDRTVLMDATHAKKAKVTVGYYEHVSETEDGSWVYRKM